jgi:hypothetical protein
MNTNIKRKNSTKKWNAYKKITPHNAPTKNTANVTLVAENYTQSKNFLLIMQFYLAIQTIGSGVFHLYFTLLYFFSFRVRLVSIAKNVEHLI